MRAGCAISAFAAGLLLPTLAAAQGRDMLRLDWRAPAGCPSARAVREAALRSSGGAAGLPIDGSAEVSPLDVKAQVEHGSRWRVTIQTSRDGAAAETRSLEAASCGALADATAAVLGVALIPAHALARTASDAAKDGTGAAATEPASVVGSAGGGTTPSGAGANGGDAVGARVADGGPKVAAAAGTDDGERAVRPAREEHRVAVAVEFAGDAGVLPATAAGARIAVAWTPRAFRLELSGAYFSGQARTAGASGAGADFGLLTIGGRGCWAALRRSVEIGPCGGVDVQHMTADGFGAATNFQAIGTWAAATLGGLLRIPVTRMFALRGDVDGVVPFTRPRFVVENDGAVHKPAGIGARAAIGAELNFL